MGYTTDFYGQFTLDRPLTPEHKLYLEEFAATRRIQRNALLLATQPDLIREAAGLPLGEEGAYYVGGTGQGYDASILDYNRPPQGQPSLWCQWVPNDEGTAIEWDEGEKFYNYEEWIEYLIEHFLAPWGYSLNGEVSWQGEAVDDRGIIRVVDNIVTAKSQERRDREVAEFMGKALAAGTLEEKQHFLKQIADVIGISQSERTHE